jgi:hypothetical protein
VSKSEDWECRRSDGDHKETFENILDRMNLQGAVAVMKKLSKTLEDTSGGLAWGH